MGMEGCTDAGLSERVFYDRRHSLLISIAPNFPVEPVPTIALHADLVFRGVLRDGNFAPATLPSGVSYPPGMGRLGGQLGQHLTYVLMQFPGTRELKYVSKSWPAAWHQ